MHVPLRFLIALVAIMAFSFHSAAMAGLPDHSCERQGLHAGAYPDHAVMADDDHSSEASFTPCCISACTLHVVQFPPAIPGVGLAARVTARAEGVPTGIQPEGPRRPPRPAAC